MIVVMSVDVRYPTKGVVEYPSLCARCYNSHPHP